MLATIIATTGSTPASAFSKMLIAQNGTRLTGSIGGGCMEADVLQAARRLFHENRAAILTFHLNEDEYVQGLICGGSLDVLIEPIHASSLPLFRRLQERCDNGDDSVLATILSPDGTIMMKRILDSDGSTEILGLMDAWESLHPSNVLSVGVSDLSEEVRKAFHRHQTRRVKLGAFELLLEPIAGAPQLFIFGAGHVSKFISQAAALVGFRTTVVDDRPEYANPERFPEAHRTVVASFPEAFDHVRISSSSFVVIVTRGHRYDEEILEHIIGTQARYIGMIGSRRKVLAAYRRLIERGTAPELLGRIHAPMGLAIGAATPEEIAVSVVAELIAVRRGHEGIVPHKSDAMKQLLAQLNERAHHL